jgi:hypothetical protein
MPEPFEDVAEKGAVAVGEFVAGGFHSTDVGTAAANTGGEHSGVDWYFVFAHGLRPPF